MQKFTHVALLVLFALASLPAIAQIRTPAPSPSAEIEQMVGLTEVSVEYSRPGMRGRTIFAADGLVPFGEVWRTGANAATMIEFSTDVTVAGKMLDAGSYAILTKPMADQWEVMFFPYESSSWTSYTDMEPAATVTAEVMEYPMTVESFTIAFGDLKMDGASLMMMWENTAVSLPISVEVDEMVMADIDRVMAGPSTNDYYNAASYLLQTEKELDKALEYIQKANASAERYWMVRTEALILEKLGRKTEAITAAKKSLELAKEAGNNDFVRMNEKSIKEWSM